MVAGGVDQLKLVDVDKQHGTGLLFQLAALPGLLRQHQEMVAVIQPGQRVMRGQICQLFMRNFLFGDIDQRAVDKGFALCIAAEPRRHQRPEGCAVGAQAA